MNLRPLGEFSAPPSVRPNLRLGEPDEVVRAMPEDGFVPSEGAKEAAPEPPSADVPTEDRERVLTWGQRVGVAGLAALSLFGGLVAGVAKAEAGSAPREATSISQSLDRELLRLTADAVPDGSSGWLLADSRAPASKVLGPRAMPDPKVLLQQVDKPAVPKPPVVSPRATVQKGDYAKYRVNFSNLITDAEFEDSGALSAPQIQDLLENMNSFLADHEAGDEAVSGMVARVAKENKINPWLLLVTLEKESSMVSRQKVPGKHSLRSAMGYGYHDGGGKMGKRSNLAFQLENGAKLLRDLYDQGKTLDYPRSVKVDYGKRTIKVRNAATWALMKYTPHTVDTRLGQVGGGNYLFRKILERFQDRHVEMSRLQPEYAQQGNTELRASQAPLVRQAQQALFAD